MHSGNAFTGRLVVEPKLQTTWGLYHAIWFLCMGLGSGLYLNRLIFGIEVGTLWGMPLADVLGIVLVGIGGLILIADLGRPLAFFYAFRNWRRSWISQGAIADFIFLGLGVLLILPDLQLGGSRPLAGLPWAAGTGTAHVMAWVAAACALYIIVYPGLALSFSPSIPFWNTTLIPLQYLGSALAGAAGVAYLLGADGSGRTLAVVALTSVLATLTLTVAHVINARQQRGAAQASLDKVMKGDLALHFVWGNLLLGLILPAFLLTLHITNGVGGAMLALAGLLILAGNFFSKYAVIKAGYYAPLF